MSELRERILVVEDELPMRTVLCDCLERRGYRVILAADGEAGLDRALREKPDLIVLDVMMPKIDGFTLCAELRRLGFKSPLLMLTAKGRVEDRVNGLERGADDYLVKPFSRDELLARVRSLLRRWARESPAQPTADLGDVHVDFIRQDASRNGQPLHLTAKEFALLRLMLERPGEVISREQFLDLVWGYASFPTTRTVDRHIASLRGKIEADADHPRFIHTVHAAGYRFEPAPGPGERAGDVTKASQHETNT